MRFKKKKKLSKRWSHSGILKMGNIQERDYRRNSKEKNSIMSRLGSKLSAITKW